MKRVALLLLSSSMLFVAACGKKEAGAEAAPAADRPANQPKVFQNYTTHLDLWEHAHLAEIDHHGLYVELGTPARHKFTYGEWRSGWGKDGVAGADCFSYAGSEPARIYFRAEKSEPLTLRVRLKPVGTSVVTVYMNGEALPATRLSGSEFKDYDIAVPAERVKRAKIA